MVASIRTRGDDLKAIARSWWSSMEVNAPIISVEMAVAALVFAAAGLVIYYGFFSSSKKPSTTNGTVSRDSAGNKSKIEAPKTKKNAPAATLGEEVAQQGKAKDALSKESNGATKESETLEGASDRTKKKKKKAKKAVEGEEKTKNTSSTLRSIISKTDDAALEPPRADVHKDNNKKGENNLVESDEARRRREQEEEDSITAMNLAKAEYAAAHDGKDDAPQNTSASADVGWDVAGTKKKKKNNSNTNLASVETPSGGATISAPLPTG